MQLMWVIFWFVVATSLSATIVIGNIVLNTTPPAGSTAAFESTKAVLLCLGGSGVVISSYFTAMNAFYQRKADTIKSTFELLTKWDDPHMFNARKWTRRTKDQADDKSKNQLLKDIGESEDLKNSVILVLNYFEHVRFSLRTKRIDKDLFKSSLGPTIINIATRFRPYAETHGATTVSHLDELIEALK